MILVLFTGSYPYDYAVEQNFLDPEIDALIASFDRVILVPQVCKGKRVPLPAGVDVVEGYCASHKPFNQAWTMLQALFSPILYRELFIRPDLFFHPAALARLVSFLRGAILTERWLKKWLVETHLDISACIFYTYWFDYAAMGIGLVKQRHPEMRLVSRAHGYDIFEERYSPPYWPARTAALAVVDDVFSVSAAGADYLRQHYPAFATQIEVARLGVPDPGFLAPASTEGVLRVVSCSIIRPVKRIDLLLEGLTHAARQRPEQRFEWCHLGESEIEGVREELQGRAAVLLPPNTYAHFPGYSSHAALMEYYRVNPVDVFVNVSISEGTPVSTMEALSCGIPVIATEVGGNRETVNDLNGILLPPDPSPADIAAALLHFIDAPDKAAAARKASRALWDERFNAEMNFKDFIQRLKQIRREAGSI